MACGCSKDGKDKIYTIVDPYGRAKKVKACCQACAEGKPCTGHSAPSFSLKPIPQTLFAYGYENSDVLVLDESGGGRLGQRPAYTIETPAGPLELPISRLPSPRGFALYVPGGCGPETTWLYVIEEDFEGNPIPGSELQARDPVEGGIDPSFPDWPCPPGVFPIFGGGFGRRGPSEAGSSPFDFIGDAVGWLRRQFAIGGEPGLPGAGAWEFGGAGVLREEPEAPPFVPILPAEPAGLAPVAPPPPQIPPAFIPRVQPRRLEVDLPAAWRRRPDKGPPIIPLPLVRSPMPFVPEEASKKAPGILPLLGLLGWSLLQ